jgi:hypothetical protein
MAETCMSDLYIYILTSAKVKNKLTCIPDDINLHQHICENLKFRIFIVHEPCRSYTTFNSVFCFTSEVEVHFNITRLYGLYDTNTLLL